jgi:GrpB-like predicted nucleotidyltransferase (UPF0157 family)
MDPVVVDEPDPDWPAQFAALAAPIRAAVDDLGAVVEHVGSTAVPGLAAKPVIDLDVVVWSADVVPAAIARLQALGYAHAGDLGITGREAFDWPPDVARHHLYLVVAGSTPHRDHVDFRDALLADPVAAAEYAALKRRLAAEHRNDRDAYVVGKTTFVRGVLARARSAHD